SEPLDARATTGSKISLRDVPARSASAKPTKALVLQSNQALREEIRQLRWIGRQMSNLCFNLSQRPGEPLSQRNAEVMRELYRQWDAIRRTEVTSGNAR